VEAEPAIRSATSEQLQEEVAVVAQKIVVSEDPRKEQLTQIARDYHDATARIIRMWLQEDMHKARAQTASNGR
jgi:flagellar biosynthesis/type III secretory pathway M-ring protein FliF/YscJ